MFILKSILLLVAIIGIEAAAKLPKSVEAGEKEEAKHILNDFLQGLASNGGPLYKVVEVSDVAVVKGPIKLYLYKTILRTDKGVKNCKVNVSLAVETKVTIDCENEPVREFFRD